MLLQFIAVALALRRKMKNRTYINHLYQQIKSFEYRTPSLFGALIALTLVFVLILFNIASVQSVNSVINTFDQRLPTGTIEVELSGSD